MNFCTNQNGDAVSGFALLSFNGPNIDIRYIDEDGFKFAEEVWQAPPKNRVNALVWLEFKSRRRSAARSRLIL